MLISLCAAVFSVQTAVSYGVLWQFLDYIIIFYLIVYEVRTRNHVLILVYSLISIGSFLAIWGLMKYLGAHGKIGYELSSTYVNSNHLAAYLEMVIPVSIAILLGNDMDTGKRVLLAYCLFMMMVAFVLTLSRGGWFSLFWALVIVGLLSIKKYQLPHLGKKLLLILLIVGVALCAVVGVGFNNVNYQLSSFFVQKRRSEIESFNGRVPIWKATLDLIRDYPMFGSGPGTFPYMYEKYLKLHIGDEYAHSEYLQVMAEWGILSLLIVLWIQIVVFRESTRLFLTSRSKVIRNLALGITGSLTAISIHSLVDFNLHFMANMFVVVVLSGIVAGSNIQNTNGKRFSCRMKGYNGLFDKVKEEEKP